VFGLSGIKKEFSNWLTNYPVAWIIAGIGISISWMSLQLIENHTRHEAKQQFEWVVNERFSAIQQAIKMEILVLENIRGLFLSSDFVARDEFYTFTNPILERGHTIQALEWIPRVRHEQRDSFERNARKIYPTFQFTQLASDGQMISASRRKEYYPVYYLTPYQGTKQPPSKDGGFE
jgi:CHASE1-domain containing sensor protein